MERTTNFYPPKEVRGRIVFNEFITSKVKHCRIEHIDPISIDFEPGQYFTIKISDEIKRAYSIGSLPEQNNYVDTYVDISPGGPGSLFFESAKSGDEVEYIMPQGRFVYQKGDSPLLFVSTGTGIVPFLCMIESSLKSGVKREIKLLQGVRFKEDIFLLDRLEDLKTKYKNFDFDYCLSKEENWNGNQGRVTSFMPQEIKRLGPQTVIYTCGAKDTVNSIIEVAREAGVPFNQIKYEKY